jgi:transcriptional regulator with XRE-family HTH domain
MTPYQIGKSIRKARGTRSIREVAPACGLSRHQVTSIESASTNYTIGSLLALCKELGCTITITKDTP